MSAYGHGSDLGIDGRIMLSIYACINFNVMFLISINICDTIFVACSVIWMTYYFYIKYLWMCLTSECMTYLECMCRFHLREYVHPRTKTVAVAVSCMYSVVYVFLRR